MSIYDEEAEDTQNHKLRLVVVVVVVVVAAANRRPTNQQTNKSTNQQPTAQTNARDLFDLHEPSVDEVGQWDR